MKATRVTSKDLFKKIIELRKSILHPDGPIERVQYAADHSEETVHLAIFDENNVILACGTMLMEDESEGSSKSVGRIRGMAVSESSQGKGLGAVILDGLIDEAIERKVQKIWCNARSKILKFYFKRDFESVGDEFITAGGVPHFKLIKSITYKDKLR